MNPIAFTTIAALATLPIAALSWIVIEKPDDSKISSQPEQVGPAGEHQPAQTVSG